jgi:zinc transport system substrate-binding protein
MKLKTCLLFALLSLSGALGLPGLASADDRPVVFASNYPLYFFAREIADGRVEVLMPDIEGDPAYWAPNGDQAAALQAADLILLNGAGFEGWLDFVSLREERLVDTTAGLKDRLLPLDEATVHQHGPEGEHSHAGTAFTTWLDPQLAAAQAEVVAAALSKLVPEGRQRFAQGLATLQARLQQLDEGLRQAFADLGDQPVVFSHPVYQYLQARYRLNGRSVHWEPDQSPGTKAWVAFVNLLMEHPARLLIWEQEPLAETRGRVQEQGVASVVFEPAGNRPAHGDYFAVMERNRQRFQHLSRMKP